MKTLTEILQTRRSTRKFDGRRPTRETVQGLLEMAFMAPSSKNSRSTRFVVVEDAAALARMARMRDFGSALLADAPCAVLVCGDTSATDLWVDNAAISATVLQLAAVEKGLASCWVHVNGRPRHQQAKEQPAPSLAEPRQGAVAPPQDAAAPVEGVDYSETAEDFLRTFLPLPAEWKPLCAIALGYSAEPERPRTPRDNADKIMWI